MPATTLFTVTLASQLTWIVGGALTSDYPGTVAIGAINGSEGAAFCTGTVISEGWVLTAAHCLEDAQNYEDDGWTLYAFEANDLLTEGPIASSTWRATYTPDSYPDAGSEADLVLIELDTPLSQPVPLLSGGINQSWVGRELTFVGFGWTSASAQNPGTKRELIAPIESVEDGLVITYEGSANLCYGDSGGSGLVSDGAGGWMLAAMPVYVVPADPCEGGRAASVRIDAWRPWLNETMGIELVDTGGDSGLDTGLGGADKGGWACASAPRGGEAAGLGLAVLLLLGVRRRE